MLISIAPAPTATPKPTPPSSPPLGRLKPNGASEKLAFRPRRRAPSTPSQKRQTTRIATVVFVRTTESRVPLGSLTGAAFQVDLVRRPAAGHVHGVPALAQELAHVEHARERGVEPRLLIDLARGARGDGLPWLQPATRQDPVGVAVRFLVLGEQEPAPARHYSGDPHPKVHLR